MTSVENKKKKKQRKKQNKSHSKRECCMKFSQDRIIANNKDRAV